MIKHVDLSFHRTDEQSPPRSGAYIVYTSANTMLTLSYSKKHHAWNCNDDDEEDPPYKIDYLDSYITAWADMSMAKAKLNRWRN